MFIENVNILVVGAGGLGCEILKNLAVLGIKNISIIDLDTIELTNLNRQFLFRLKDIGHFKAEVASNFIKERYSHVDIKWYTKKVQEFDINFFADFQVIIGGLDNIEARKYLNNVVHRFLVYDEYGNINQEYPTPVYIDGGTEGFRGQSQIVIPVKNSSECFECNPNKMAKRNTVATCTLTNTPRTPEHCVLYIKELVWPNEFKKPIDTDNFDDIKWIYDKALERANTYKIDGVTLQQTLGTIKNVIPAIPSTNAIIAASLVLETIKVLSGCSLHLKYYMMYMGHEGLNTEIINYEKNPNCSTCHLPTLIECDSSITLEHFINAYFKAENAMNLMNPTIKNQNDTIVYVPGPEIDEKEHHYKLSKTLNQLVDDKELIIGNGKYLKIVDKMFDGDHRKVMIKFK